MRNRAFKVVLLALAAAGGVVAWQRKHETPPVAPGPRPSEPFLDPAAPVQTPLASPGTPPPTSRAVQADVAGGPAEDAGVVVEAREGTPLADDTPPAPVPAAQGEPDDLTRISGIGPKLEVLLHAQGITTYAQLAGLDDAGIDALQARLPGFPGRIRRDDWVGQSTRLMGG